MKMNIRILGFLLVWLVSLFGSSPRACASEAGAYRLFGLDVVTDNLVEIDTTTGQVTTIFKIPFDVITFDGFDYNPADGSLYIAREQSGKVDFYKVDLASKTVSLSKSIADADGSYASLGFKTSGDFYGYHEASAFNLGTLKRGTWASGSVQPLGTTGTPSVLGGDYDESRNVFWATDEWTGKVYQLSVTDSSIVWTSTSTWFSTSGPGDLLDMDIAPNGDILVGGSDHGAQDFKILKLDPNTGVWATWLTIPGATEYRLASMPLTGTAGQPINKLSWWHLDEAVPTGENGGKEVAVGYYTFMRVKDALGNRIFSIELHDNGWGFNEVGRSNSHLDWHTGNASDEDHTLYELAELPAFYGHVTQKLRTTGWHKYELEFNHATAKMRFFWDGVLIADNIGMSAPPRSLSLFYHGFSSNRTRVDDVQVTGSNWQRTFTFDQDTDTVGLRSQQLNLFGANGFVAWSDTSRPRTGAGAWAVGETEGYGEGSSATLIINQPLGGVSISQQPTDQEIYLGQTATFSVTATGPAPIAYQWFLNGRVIAGATSASYSVRATPASRGTYTVRVSNVQGSVFSEPALLDARAARYNWTDASGSQRVVVGNTASFGVENVTGPTEAVSYQWFKDGKAVPGATSATLGFDAVTVANAGRYSLVITTAAGKETTESRVLSVEDPGTLVYSYGATVVDADPVGERSSKLIGFFVVDRINGQGALVLYGRVGTLKVQTTEGPFALSTSSTGPVVGSRTVFHAATTGEDLDAPGNVQQIWLTGRDALVRLSSSVFTLAPSVVTGVMGRIEDGAIEHGAVALALSTSQTLATRTNAESLEDAVSRIQAELSAKGYLSQEN